MLKTALLLAKHLQKNKLINNLVGPNFLFIVGIYQYLELSRKQAVYKAKVVDRRLNEDQLE